MKFLKVLLNSVLSGLFFSFLLALLILDLNIQKPFEVSLLLQTALYLFITYGLLVTAFCVVFFFVVQFFSGKKMEIRSISPVFLLTSFTSVLVFFLILFYQNRRYFESMISPDAARLQQYQFLALLFLCSTGLILFFGYFIFRKNASWLIMFFLFFILCVPYAVIQRNAYPESSSAKKVAKLKFGPIQKRFTVIGMEGLSYDFIIPLINQDKLPNFAWLMNEGGWGTLESFTPNEPILLNNTFSTGKWPYKHGRLSLNKLRLIPFPVTIQIAPRYIFFYQLDRLGLLNTLPYEPEWICKDIWHIFSSNQTPFVKNEQVCLESPETISEGWETMFNRYYREMREDDSNFSNIIMRAFYSDACILDQVSSERESIQPQLVFFNLGGLKLVEKYFYKFSFPELFSEVDQEDINKYNTVISRYYQFYDEILGRYLAAKKDNEMLVVYSSHGIEPLPVWKRGIEFLVGNPQISAYHENAPEGAVFFYGKEIARSRNIESMKIVDMAPTLLHYLGLPLGKDMDGIVNSSIFRSIFKMENPVIYISSYEEMEIIPPGKAGDTNSSLLPVSNR
jgi:predicted AlkP superfamily phosphohydrolase/phosphomutase